MNQPTISAARPVPGERTAVLWLVGATAFVAFYAPQPLVPTLARAFGVSPTQAAHVISALAGGVMCGAPIIGVVSDRVGRRRLIATSAMVAAFFALSSAFATSIAMLSWLRFGQGMATAGVLVNALAFAGEEASDQPGRAMSAYISGTVLGGFTGRMLTGVLEPILGWRGSFAALGALMVVAASLVMWQLPVAARFVPHPAPHRELWSLMRRPGLVAGWVVGFGVLFTLVALMTFVTIRLDGPPWRWGPTALSFVFVIYLFGLVITPMGGRAIDRWGARAVLQASCAAACVGLALTIATHPALIVAGLAVTACALFVAQVCGTSWVGARGGRARATATGMYVALYYAGGAVGAAAPAGLWRAHGWNGVVSLLVGAQLLIALVATAAWKAPRSPGPPQATGPSATRANAVVAAQS